MEAKTSGEHQTPLFYAARNDACNSMKALIKAGAEYKYVRDYKGRTPLHYLYASCDSSGEAEDFVEEAKNDYNIEFNVNAVDCNGRTPIQYRREVEIRRVRDKLISLDYF